MIETNELLKEFVDLIEHLLLYQNESLSLIQEKQEVPYGSLMLRNKMRKYKKY